MSGDQLRRLKEFEKENERLRRAVSDLTLDKQILKEAAIDIPWPCRTSAYRSRLTISSGVQRFLAIVGCMDASRDARTDFGVTGRQIAALYPAY